MFSKEDGQAVFQTTAAPQRLPPECIPTGAAAARPWAAETSLLPGGLPSGLHAPGCGVARAAELPAATAAHGIGAAHLPIIAVAPLARAHVWRQPART
ncbi:hypothetical protein MTO96_017424 [Rhipicephalus appendiculatus]